MEIAILQDIKSITLAATGSTTKRQHTTTNIRLKAMGIAVQYLGSEMPQDTSQLIEKTQTRDRSWKLV